LYPILMQVSEVKSTERGRNVQVFKFETFYFSSNFNGLLIGH
jgi:hypothetical protein